LIKLINFLGRRRTPGKKDPNFHLASTGPCWLKTARVGSS